MFNMGIESFLVLLRTFSIFCNSEYIVSQICATNVSRVFKLMEKFMLKS